MLSKVVTGFVERQNCGLAPFCKFTSLIDEASDGLTTETRKARWEPRFEKLKLTFPTPGTAIVVLKLPSAPEESGVLC